MKAILPRQTILTVAIAILAAITVNAQPSYRIEGKLHNFMENKPVEFASVSLHNLTDSSLVTGAISDTSGRFSIANLKEGSYFIKVSCIGFKPAFKNGILLNSATPTFNMGTIDLNAEAQTLKEVTVEGERLKGVAEVDKTVYTINSKAAVSAHSGLELLRQVPAVQVDFQNNISLEGKSNIMVLVDGKQRDKEYLAQLNPNSIDKIEVMTNPSVKYEADVTGVINIILKREKKHGISGQFRPEIPLSERVVLSNTNASIEYGYNKFRVFVSSYANYQKFEMLNTNDRINFDNGNTTRYFQRGDGTAKFYSLGIDFGVDYFINSKNTLNLYGNTRPISGRTFKTEGFKELYLNDQLQTYIDGYSYDNGENTSNYISAFYKRTFEKPTQELTLDVNYSNYSNNRDANYKDQYYQSDRITPSGNLLDRRELGDDRRDAFGLKLDYVQPLSKDQRIAAGYNNYSQWIDNKFFVESDASENNLRYNEQRHAAYTSYTGKVKNLSIQAGLRYELSLIDINSSTNIDYDCFLPQLTLQQKIGKSNSVKLTYRRSIQRPGINNLNPFVNQIDSITISRGNPYLKPSYSNKAELNYSVPIKNSYVSAGVYYNYFTDNFQRVTRIVNGRISETFVDNIGTGAEYGVNFSGSLKLTKWWQLNPYICLYNVQLDENKDYQIDQKQKLSYRLNATSTFTLPKKFSIFVYTQMNSPYISTQNTNKREPMYVLGIEKQVKTSFKFTLTTINPFNRYFNISNTVTESENFWQESITRLYIQNLIMLRVGYTFNYGNKIKKLERQKEVENEGNKSMF